MDTLQKIVKVTQQQYDTLKNGGTVGGYTGLNSNYIYLVVDENEYLPLSGGIMKGSLTIEQGNAINVSQYNDASGVSLMNNGDGTVTQFGSSSRPARIFSSVQPEWYKNGASQGVLAIKGDIPTKTSQLTNDSGFLTSHQDISGKLDKSGGTINAGGTKTPLILKGGANNFDEGLRIIPSNSWSTIVLGGNDIGESQGTSANSWSIHNYNGSFFISKNGSDYAAIKLSNTDGTWRVNDNTIIHSGNIGSQSVSYATTAGTANSVALKASSGGATKATMQYNTTEDCIEFIFS